MEDRPIIECGSDDTASIFFKGGHWKRVYYEPDTEYDFHARDPIPHWYAVNPDADSDDRLEATSTKVNVFLEDVYDARKSDKKIRRFPRLGVPDKITNFYEIPCIDQFKNLANSWIVDELIPDRSLTLLTAPPSGFKTWFALFLAGAVSQGIDFLGRKTHRRPVLYLDRENPKSVIRERVKILGLDEGYYLKIWGRWMVKDPPPPIGDRRLVQIAKELHPLMIFDSSIRFHSGDENDTQRTAEVSEEFRRTADAGAAVVILAHQDKAKSSRYRGCTEILAGVDAAFALSQHKSKLKTILKLECFKHRSMIEECEMSLCTDFENGRFALVDDNSPAAISSALRERIVAAIEQKSGISQQELMKLAKLPETNGRKILQQSDGIHWVTKRGKGTTLRYYLKD